MISQWKGKALLALMMTGFLFSESASSIGADRRIDTERSTLKIHVGKAGLFSVAGHDHWVTARFAEGSFNDSDFPRVSFAVDARGLALMEDDKLSPGEQAEVQHTMHVQVLESETYPLISFHSVKIQKAGADHWIVFGDLTLHGRTKPIQADVRIGDGAYTGHAKIKQTDFGINPVSVAGGVVKVKNELEIYFVVVPLQ